MNTHVRDQLISILPIATLILRAAPYTTTETAVEGRWLQANGVAVSRTTYSALFNYLNGLSPALPFGAGNGTTTFTLPDLRGRGAVAEGEHADVDSMGDSDGEVIASRTPKHKHIATFGGIGGNSQVLGDVALGDSGAGTISGIGPQTGAPTDSPAYLVVGSYFIKFTS